MLSYWEKSSLIEYDLVVVGGGLVGSFAALTYRKYHPKARIALLERGILPSGASTKNAGFACFGSISELQEDLNDCNLDELVALTEKRFKGIEYLRANLSDTSIGYEAVKGYELVFKTVESDQLAFFNDALSTVFGKNPFSDQTASLNAYPFGSKVRGLIEHAFEGTVHTGMLMKALHQKLQEEGISCFTGSELVEFEETPSGVSLWVASSKQKLQFKSQQLVFCTNAFTQHFFPELDITPGRGLVIVTHPIENFRLSGSFHYHSGYNYFRCVNNRILLGGARHLDKSSETTTAFGVNEKIQNQLIEDLHTIIAPDYKLEVDYSWSGIMAFGKNKQPIVRKMSDRIAVAARLGGMGVALGSLVGKEVIELLE